MDPPLRVPALEQLLEPEPLVDTARSLLGPSVMLRASCGRVTFPGRERMQTGWHVDHALRIDPPPPLVTTTPVVGCVVYLDDITEESGPTHVVPGSHLRGVPPPASEDVPGAVGLCPRAGSVLFFHASLWHRGGRNSEEGALRRVIILHFAQSGTRRRARRLPRRTSTATRPPSRNGRSETGTGTSWRSSAAPGTERRRRAGGLPSGRRGARRVGWNGLGVPAGVLDHGECSENPTQIGAEARGAGHIHEIRGLRRVRVRETARGDRPVRLLVDQPHSERESSPSERQAVEDAGELAFPGRENEGLGGITRTGEDGAISFRWPDREPPVDPRWGPGPIAGANAGRGTRREDGRAQGLDGDAE